MYQQWPQSIVPFVNFIFSHYETRGLKGRGAIGEIPERLQSGHGGCEAVGGRLLAVGQAVGAGVGVWECIWGRAGVLGGGGSPRPPAPSSDSLPPLPPCDIPSGFCVFTGPWTVTRSSLRMLRRVAAFCRPLRPVLLLVSFPRSRSPVVGVPGLCWLWRDVPFARQRRPIIGVLGVVLVVAGVV